MLNGRYASICTEDLKYAESVRAGRRLGLIDKSKFLALPCALMDGMNERGLACSNKMPFPKIY